MQTSNILPNVYYKEMVDQFFVSSNTTTSVEWKVTTLNDSCLAARDAIHGWS